jgi:undecaprenyl diphosphate synthase
MAAEIAARLPVHVAIIMDGNGRWAERRGKPRSAGHLEGVKAAKRIVKAASSAGIRYLTLFTFSTENWNRSPREVSYLMFLIKNHLRKEYKFYHENKIRVVHSGCLDRVPPDVVREIRRVTADTAHYEGMTVNLAIDYGGRDEILRAFNRLMGEGSNGEVTEAQLRAHLDQPEVPDPDLVVRTGEESRVSNFLLWQLAYSELYFSEKLWPDWHAEDLLAALAEFARRERRFGAAQPRGGTSRGGWPRRGGAAAALRQRR